MYASGPNRTFPDSDMRALECGIGVDVDLVFNDMLTEASLPWVGWDGVRNINKHHGDSSNLPVCKISHHNYSG